MVQYYFCREDQLICLQEEQYGCTAGTAQDRHSQRKDCAPLEPSDTERSDCVQWEYKIYCNGLFHHTYNWTASVVIIIVVWMTKQSDRQLGPSKKKKQRACWDAMSASRWQSRHNLDRLEKLWISGANSQSARISLKYFTVDTRRQRARILQHPEQHH